MFYSLPRLVRTGLAIVALCACAGFPPTQAQSQKKQYDQDSVRLAYDIATSFTGMSFLTGKDPNAEAFMKTKVRPFMNEEDFKTVATRALLEVYTKQELTYLQQVYQTETGKSVFRKQSELAQRLAFQGNRLLMQAIKCTKVSERPEPLKKIGAFSQKEYQTYCKRAR